MRVGAAGGKVWGRRLGVDLTLSASGVAEGGGIVAVSALGQRGAVVDLGEANITLSGQESAVLAVYGAEDGRLLWFSVPDGDVQLSDVAVSDTGAVYLSGTSLGALTVEGEAVAAEGGFVLAYDTAGAVQWSRTYGSSRFRDGCLALATDDEGHVFVGGEAGTPTDFGAGTVPIDSRRGYAVAYDALGNHLWSVLMGEAPTSRVSGLEAGERGSLYLAGFAATSVDLGGENVQGHFVAAFQR